MGSQISLNLPKLIPYGDERGKKPSSKRLASKPTHKRTKVKRTQKLHSICVLASKILNITRRQMPKSQVIKFNFRKRTKANKRLYDQTFSLWFCCFCRNVHFALVCSWCFYML